MSLRPPLSGFERNAISTSMTAAMAAVILARMTGAQLFSMAAWAATLATVATSLRVIRARELYLLGICIAIGTAVVMWHPDATDVLGAALDRASMLMSFILLLGLLYAAAVNSPSVAAFGPYITRQPPSRRYVSIHLGTGALTVLFNTGIIGFIVPIVQKGVWGTDPDDPLNPVRERRQVTAIQRGFAWSIVCSPTALAPLLLLELVPDIDRGLWLAWGAAVFLLMMMVGALEDTVRHRRFRLTARRPGLSFPGRAAAMLTLACAWLFFISMIAMTRTDGNFVTGLMIACPLVMAGWLAVQNGPLSRAGWRVTGARIGSVFEDFPRAAPLAITLAAAGFAGHAGAAMLPAETLGALLARLDAYPDFIILSAIPPAIAVIGLAGPSPVMMAVFIGSLLGGVPALPISPTLLALAISWGWALSMTFSPLATIALVVSGVSGIDTVTLTWRWNLAFSLIAAALGVPAFALLTALASPG